jgi:hypothetical protein
VAIFIVLGDVNEPFESRTVAGIRPRNAAESATTNVPVQCDEAAVAARDGIVGAAAGALNAWSEATTHVPGTSGFAAIGAREARD